MSLLAARKYRKWWRTSFYKNRMVLTPLVKGEDMHKDYFKIRASFIQCGAEFYEDLRYIYEEKS